MANVSGVIFDAIYKKYGQSISRTNIRKIAQSIGRDMYIKNVLQIFIVIDMLSLSIIDAVYNISSHNCKCDICHVVYMSLWSSGQRELEGREVLVLPPRGRVGWSVSLVWAFGESTR